MPHRSYRHEYRYIVVSMCHTHMSRTMVTDVVYVFWQTVEKKSESGM
jgi:hypothetical protein